MQDSILRLFDTGGFPARWYCGTWSAELGWLHILSDVAVFGAYMAIPCLLFYFTRRRPDVPFLPIFWLFCAFIAACGTTHLIEASIFWWPAYRLSAAAKLITALVSWATVIALIPVLPRALALPGLAKINTELQGEIRARRAAEAEVKSLNAELEARVAERTRQLTEVNQELEGFTYTVAHDLRAPLRHLHGFSTLLLEGPEVRSGERQEHYAQRIAHGALRMGVLVDDLLAFARTGQAAAQLERIDVNPLVAEVVDELGPSTAGRRIDWQIGSLPAVLADHTLLRTVWMNLLSNAIKFTAQRATARIEIGAQPAGAGETALYVRDNGVGFESQYADQLFGVFQRLHRDDEFAGTGIGLATVRRIIERHGGRVWADGRVDAGATVYFTLRAAEK
jgi:signal transduction histidine kinase